MTVMFRFDIVWCIFSRSTQPGDMDRSVSEYKTTTHTQSNKGTTREVVNRSQEGKRLLRADKRSLQRGGRSIAN